MTPVYDQSYTATSFAVVIAEYKIMQCILLHFFLQSLSYKHYYTTINYPTTRHTRLHIYTAYHTLPSYVYCCRPLSLR